MKSAALVISCLIFLLLALPIATSDDLSSIDSSKVDPQVLSEVEAAGTGEQIPIIVKLKEPAEVKQLGKLRAASAQALRAEKFQAFKAQEVSQLKDSISKEDFKVKRENLREGYFSAYVTEQGLEELSQNTNVESISLNHVFHIALQDSVPLINASTLQAMSLSNGMKINGTGQTVCVIDTGVNYTHPSLGSCSNLTSCSKVLDGYDFVNSDSDPRDDNGHGTHVSGIVAASGGITGVALGAKLVVIKALDASGDGNEDDIAAGIDWCVGNKSKYNISVITMSIGTQSYHNISWCDSDMSLIAASTNSAVGNGIIVTVATGNEYTYTAISAPACIQNSTRITATTKADAYADYANRGGSFTDIIAAPGTNINSTTQTVGTHCVSSGQYGTCSGTSMATPHAAGAAALLQEYKQQEEHLNLTPQQIEDALIYGGDLIYDSQSSRNYSRINLLGSLRVIDRKAPSLALLFPTEGTIVASNNSISLNLSVADVNMNTSSCKYSINGAANQTIASCANTTFGVPSAGAYNLTIYANDLALNDTGSNRGGNLNFSTVSFTISSNITMNLTSPANGTVFNPGAFLNFTISATSSISSAKYYNGTTNRTMANTSATNWYINTTDWPTGQRDIIVYATDTIGNLESAAYTFFLDYAPTVSAWNWSNGTDSSSTIGQIYSRENDSLAINLTVSDTDAFSNLSYVWNVSNVTSSRFTNTSQNLTWRIGFQDRGNYTISVNISDTKMSTTKQWNISISDFGSISWTAGLPDAVSEETDWTYNVSQFISNPDNDPLNFSVSRYSIDSYGIISSSFGCSSSGTYIEDVLVLDGIASIGDSFYVVVTDSRACQSGGTSGGSSSNPDNTTLDTVSKTFTTVSPQVESKFELSEIKIPISEVAFKPNEILQNVKMTVKALSAKPGGIPDAPKEVYKYMEVSATNMNDSKISSARIEFKVDNLWMTSENVNPADIKLVRYKDGWQNLSAIVIAKDTAYTTFISQVPGFSYFAITGTPGAIEEVTFTGAAATGTNETPSNQSVSIGNVQFTNPFAGKVIPRWMILLVLMLIVAVGAALIWKFAHRSKPDSQAQSGKRQRPKLSYR